jgi:ferrochelatase
MVAQWANSHIAELQNQQAVAVNPQIAINHHHHHH